MNARISISSPFSQLLMGVAFAAGLAASANATTVLIDFGGTTNTTPTTGGQSWNNLTSTMGAVVGTPLSNLVATTGTGTGISLSIVSRFNGNNDIGTTSGLAPYPSTATGDSLFGNTGSFGAGPNIFPAFRLSGLVVGQSYDLTFFASRTGVSDNRETLYTVTGSTSGSVALNASNNVSNTVTYSVTPNASGEILINIGPGPNNDNPTTRFTYLNVLEINTVPEPGSLALAGLGGLLLLRRKRD